MSETSSCVPVPHKKYWRLEFESGSESASIFKIIGCWEYALVISSGVDRKIAMRKVVDCGFAIDFFVKLVPEEKENEFYHGKNNTNQTLL